MHGIIPLLDPSMVLLQAIIEVFIGPMEHLVAQHFTHGSWVGGVTVRRHLFRRMDDNGQSLLEELLGRLQTEPEQLGYTVTLTPQVA